MLLSFNRLDPLHLVALRETTFTEEATSAISDKLARFVVVLGIHGLHFLLDGLSIVTEKMIGVKINGQKLA